MKEELQNIPQSIKYKGKSANIYQNKIKKQTLLQANLQILGRKYRGITLLTRIGLDLHNTKQ